MSKPSDIVQFDGENCSRVYARMLTMARADGVHFHLDSGFRSVKEQWVLYLKHKRNPQKYPLAAFPGSSTHNKSGWKQGLDINSIDGGTRRVIDWARRHGMSFSLTVVGEAWHINAATDYTHHIYQMWENYVQGIERAKIAHQRQLEIDRRNKLRRHK